MAFSAVILKGRLSPPTRKKPFLSIRRRNSRLGGSNFVFVSSARFPSSSHIFLWKNEISILTAIFPHRNQDDGSEEMRRKDPLSFWEIWRRGSSLESMTQFLLSSTVRHTSCITMQRTRAKEGKSCGKRGGGRGTKNTAGNNGRLKEHGPASASPVTAAAAPPKPRTDGRTGVAQPPMRRLRRTAQEGSGRKGREG